MAKKLIVLITTALLVFGSAGIVSAKDLTYDFSETPVKQADFPDQH